LAVALNRAVSPKDLAHTPVLADLAELLDGRRTRAAEAVPQAAAQVLDRETAPGRSQR
ncbi:MAG: hypothetical protein K0R87_2704, partial [Pseudonocardia sp.]|nr:hypothetical protein [Pseudonocardia sp.]